LKPRRSPSSGRRGRRTSNTTNRGPVLQSAPISNLLSSTPTSLNCSYLAEPQLLFGGKALCVDPRTGLAAYGPYSKTDASRRTAIRVGIVGPADAIDRAVALIERFSHPIDQLEKVDAVLHPPFPGLNAGEPFQVEIVSHREASQPSCGWLIPSKLVAFFFPANPSWPNSAPDPSASSVKGFRFAPVNATPRRP
jgi:hypothetical protein